MEKKTENRKYPRYKVVDQDGKLVGIAVCNLETEAPQEQKRMEGKRYPRYEVVDRDGKVIGFAVSNLELEEPQKPPVRKDQASGGNEVELKDLSE